MLCAEISRHLSNDRRRIAEIRGDEDDKEEKGREVGSDWLEDYDLNRKKKREKQCVFNFKPSNFQELIRFLMLSHSFLTHLIALFFSISYFF